MSDRRDIERQLAEQAERRQKEIARQKLVAQQREQRDKDLKEK